MRYLRRLLYQAPHILSDLVVAMGVGGGKDLGHHHIGLQTLQVKPTVGPKVQPQAFDFGVVLQDPPRRVGAGQVREGLVDLFDDVERAVFCWVVPDARKLHQPQNLQAVGLRCQDLLQPVNRSLRGGSDRCDQCIQVSE